MISGNYSVQASRSSGCRSLLSRPRIAAGRDGEPQCVRRCFNLLWGYWRCHHTRLEMKQTSESEHSVEAWNMIRDGAFMSLTMLGRRSLAYGASVLILFSVALLGLPNFVV